MAASLFAAIAAASTLPSASGARPSEPPALQLLLRLHDLAPGYLLIDGSPEFPVGGIKCDRIEPAEPKPKLARFIDRYAPAGCMALYSRLFRVPGGGPRPPVVGTGAMRLPNPEAAEEGLSVARLLLSHALSDELPEEVAPVATVGDAARLFHWQDSLFGEDDETSSFLVWRTGATLATVFVPGKKAAASDRIATELAQIQQRHVEAPTPYRPAEYDDSEVALEDPALEVPVYWLEREFSPGHGLPPLRLMDTNSTTRRAIASPRASLFYADHPFRSRYESLYVNLYSPRQWRQLRERGHALPGSLRCGFTSHELRLPRGHAVAFHGFEGFLGRCPSDERPAWSLRIRYGHVIVTVKTGTICAICAEAGTGPYNSFKGMAAIVRGLERRVGGAVSAAAPVPRRRSSRSSA